GGALGGGARPAAPPAAPRGRAGPGAGGAPGSPGGPPMPSARMPDFPPGTLVLAKGAPDVRRMPASELSRAYRRALARHGRALLGYGDPRGHPRLRRGLAEVLRGARAPPPPPEAGFGPPGSPRALG